MPLSSGLINLNVPALPDNDVAFANNAAWQAYWASINVTVSFNAAGNSQYVQSAYDNTLQFNGFVYNNVEYDFPTMAQFNSLLAMVQALNTNYVDLLTTLKAAGIITNAT